jgi:hypothetical protein
MASTRKSPTTIALDALAKIERHEKECGLRWAEATSALKNLSDQVKLNSARWEKLAWLIISSLVAGAIAIFWKNLG